jgi:hypothetical protein
VISETLHLIALPAQVNARLIADCRLPTAIASYTAADICFSELETGPAISLSEKDVHYTRRAMRTLGALRYH